MMKFYNSKIMQLDQYLQKRTKLINVLVQFFDYGSRLTWFFLFNFYGYATILLLLFFIPIYYSEEFLNFLIVLIKEPSNGFFYFKNLPFALKLLLSFYIFLLELVFFCTFLASIPLIKTKMIKKYHNPLILRERGYNMLSSSVRRATTLGLPLTAAVIVIGDTHQHAVTVQAIQSANKRVWDEFTRTGDKRILDRLQRIPTPGVATRIREVTVGALNTVVNWKSGAQTKD